MIESRTKARIPEELLKELLKEILNLKKLPELRELTDGFYNTAYIVNPESAGKSVLKIGPPDNVPVLTYEHQITRTEVKTMEIGAMIGIPVPRIIHADFSRKKLPHDFFIMEFLDGTPWNKVKETFTPEENSMIEYQLGQITQKLNNVGNDRFGYCSRPEKFTDWFECFQVMIGWLYSDAVRFGIQIPYPKEKADKKLFQHKEIFKEVKTPRLVHWDLWEGNIFVNKTKTGAEITGIIDFERAFWGDPLCEYYFQYPDAVSYLRGYFGRDKLTEQELIRRKFYDFYLMLSINTEHGPRQYTDNDFIQWFKNHFKTVCKALDEI